MEQYSVGNIEDTSAANKLGSKLTKALNFQHHQDNISGISDVGEQEYVCRDSDEEEEEDGDEKEEDLTAEILAQSGYVRSVSNQHSNVGNQEFICVEAEEKFELVQSRSAENEPSRHCPVTFPTEKKLVSAFKGSREKEGSLDRKERVTWAPDVYDPPPSSDDHFQQNKNEKRRGENKKQKTTQKRGGKSAREGKGKGKDKKQTRACGGSSRKGRKMEDDNE